MTVIYRIIMIIEALNSPLGPASIKVIWRRHAWDTQYFPHATRGYFPFWEKIKSGT